MHKLTVVVSLLAALSFAVAAPTKKASLELGAPTVSDAVYTTSVQSVMKRSSTKLLSCYKTALAKDLEGDYVGADVTFKIGPDGKVSAVNVTGMTDKANKCIAAIVAKLKFGKTKDGVTLDVGYGLSFTSGNGGGAFATLTGTGDVSSGFDDTNIYGGLLGNEAGEMQGGWGFGRQGSGSGGTGWGTIGTGRYGTIGSGSGTGYGVGGGGGTKKGVPTVSIGQPGVTGDLDKAIIRRYIKRNIQKITYCYEKQLLATKGLQGTVKAEFTIGANGLVSSAKASGLKDVDSCVAAVIKAIEFPKPKGGEVKVSYPFTFRPPGS